MKKILVATEKPFAPVAVDGIKKIIEEAGFQFALLEKYTEKSSLLEAVKDAHAVIIRSDIVDAEVIEAGKELKIVVRAGAGYDNVDLTAASAAGVVVMNTPGQNSNAVAELALGMMVYFARKKFNGKAGTELAGKTLGIHAYGYVGRLVGKIAKGFGMQVLAYDPYIPAAKMSDDGVEAVATREELYSKSQYVSLHIPATAETKGSIDETLLMSMPKGATLVNTARKEVICEDSLRKVLANRPDFGYVSDIAPNNAEELMSSHPDQVYFTPKKMGAQTAEANINAGLAAARQIRDFFEKGETTFQVNK